MPKEIKSLSNPQLSKNILSEEDIKAIHDKTLEIINTVGVRFPSTRAFDLWEENGAIVDRESHVVKFSGDIIESALNNAPSSYTLAARNSSQDLPLDGNHVYLGTDGCGIEVIDLNTGERRRST